MKRAIFSTAIILMTSLVFSCAAFSAAADVRAPKDIRNSGEIVGVVDFCGPQGTNGSVADLVGESFSAVLGASGIFKLRYVPEGAYTLRVSIPDQPEDTQPVLVVKGQVTDLGVVAICPDKDNDGFTVEVDCNDNNALIFPGAAEVCDGFDNDCDGETDEVGCSACTDADNDGFFAQAGCLTAVDCDDSSNIINPTADEICDGLDNNCDGQTDENIDFNTDPNNCGACSNVCAGGQCVSGVCVDEDQDGFTTDAGDCNDNDPTVFPGALEICNGIDNDCNGLVDDNCTNRVCTDAEVDAIQACFIACGNNFLCQSNCPADTGASDACQQGLFDLISCALSNSCEPTVVDNQCLNDNCPAELEAVFGVPFIPECTSGEIRACGTDVGECTAGTQTCVDQLWSECQGEIGPTTEICDGLDNNCDGLTDEDNVCSVCGDGIVDGDEQCDDGNNTDGDGCQADCTLPTACSDGTPDGEIRPCDGPDSDLCVNGTQTCTNGQFGVCEETVTDILEVCNGIDDDCDGQADEGACIGTGIYNIQPAATYACASGLFNLNVQTFTIVDLGGSSIQVVSGPSGPTLSGTIDPSGLFQATATVSGEATESYLLIGQFSDPDNWTGTFSVNFTGSTFDCLGQGWQITGTR